MHCVCGKQYKRAHFFSKHELQCRYKIVWDENVLLKEQIEKEKEKEKEKEMEERRVFRVKSDKSWIKINCSNTQPQIL